VEFVRNFNVVGNMGFAGYEKRLQLPPDVGPSWPHMQGCTHLEPAAVADSRSEVLRSKLRTLIKRAGVSQTDVSRGAMMGQNDLSSFLNGKGGIDIRESVALAKYFHVSLDWFLDDENQDPPPPRKSEAEDMELTPAERQCVRMIRDLYEDDVPDLMRAKQALKVGAIPTPDRASLTPATPPPATTPDGKRRVRRG
jgi:transcriptional regulator with XRE-family HTH domain